MDKFDIIKSLLEENRSIRRFDFSKKIEDSTLKKLVELTRYCASGRNLQPLRYRIVSTETECKAIFPYLAWAGYYKDWEGPEEKERPAAYIIQCMDTSLAPDCLCDDGLQLEAITLGATASGIGGCIIKSFNMQKIAEILHIQPRFKPRYVLALGYPVEKAKIVDLNDEGDIRYYRDSEQIQCVPKRPITELLL